LQDKSETSASFWHGGPPVYTRCYANFGHPTRLGKTSQESFEIPA